MSILKAYVYVAYLNGGVRRVAEQTNYISTW